MDIVNMVIAPPGRACCPAGLEGAGIPPAPGKHKGAPLRLARLILSPVEAEAHGSG